MISLTTLLKKPKRIVTIFVGSILVFTFLYNGFLKKAEDASVVEVEVPRKVATIALEEYSENGSVVASAAYAGVFALRAETGGKIIHVTNAQTVAEGAVIAEIENSAQKAALIQAQGAYDAAVAAAGGSETSHLSTLQSGVTTWRSTTASAAHTVRTVVDEYFTDPRRGIVGLNSLSGFGEAPKLTSDRVAIEAIFDRWEDESATITTENVDTYLISVRTDIMRIAALIDTLTALVPRQSISDSFTETDRATATTNLSSARATIVSLEVAVNNARTAIEKASDTNIASANASVKQAFGALESARVAYNKTIITAPFTGTLVSTQVVVGDVVGVGSDIATIIPYSDTDTVAVWYVPLTAVKYTPSAAYVFVVNKEGVLEAQEVETGLVTAREIAITGLEGTEEIIADVRGLKSGDVVIVE